QAHAPLVDAHEEQAELRIVGRREPVGAALEAGNDRLLRPAAWLGLHRHVDGRLAGLGIETAGPIDALDHRYGVEELPVGAVEHVEIAVPAGAPPPPRRFAVE